MVRMRVTEKDMLVVGDEYNVIESSFRRRLDHLVHHRHSGHQPTRHRQGDRQEESHRQVNVPAWQSAYLAAR